MDLRLLPQNKAPFGSDQLSKFANLHRKMCQLYGNCRLERRVPLRQGGWDELVGTQNRRQKWPETAMQSREATAWPRMLHVSPPPRINLQEAGHWPNDFLWAISTSACRCYLAWGSWSQNDRTLNFPGGVAGKNGERGREIRRWEERWRISLVVLLEKMVERGKEISRRRGEEEREFFFFFFVSHVKPTSWGFSNLLFFNRV